MEKLKIGDKVYGKNWEYGKSVTVVQVNKNGSFIGEDKDGYYSLYGPFGTWIVLDRSLIRRLRVKLRYWVKGY